MKSTVTSWAGLTEVADRPESAKAALEGCGANIGSRAKQEFWGLTWITRQALHTKFQVRFCF